MLEAAVHAGRGHLGGAFSCVEILMAVHEVLTGDDEFILSKGHAAIALYAILFDDLLAFCADNSYLTEHPSTLIPGVRVTTGSLGHGVGIAAGIALAKKMNGESGHVYVLVGDGECMEGSVYEAVMFSVLQKLNNLTIILDANRVMSTQEFPKDVGAYSNIFGAMGCITDTVNGHDVDAVRASLGNRYMAPQFLSARTIKGKGVSFMENAVQWHSGVPAGEQLEIARRELE
jgi:transketolase